MPTSLRATLDHLANQFAAGVLDAIRSASLEDVATESRRSIGRATNGASSRPVSAGSSRGRGRRLGRRSADDIQELIARIVRLLEGKSRGLRAEQIRSELGLQAKEMPRPLAEALSTGVISKQGQKRATTYFAGKGKAASGGAGKRKRGRKPGRKPAGRKGKKSMEAVAAAG